MTPGERARFDALMDEVVGTLPERLLSLIQEIPVIVEDEPSDDMLVSLGMDPGVEASREELCGLHTGVSLTERGVEDGPTLPTDIHLFRAGIIATAGGWSGNDADDRVFEEIRVTLLHEIGHHFGLEEDDLADLGYD